MLPAPRWLSADQFPELLLQMKGAPERLSYIGKPEALTGRSISIVGSRKMSPYGEKVARMLVPGMVRAGLSVVSGLAYGIDALSHRLALGAGGRCVAVLGGGLNRIYPQSHTSLAENIAEQGCLLSEYEPDETPLAFHFPERNRIVAGLSPLTLIIEAADRSGTLSTARHALDAGREVGVVPGDIMADQSVGVHQLLRDGARPITSLQDILDVYGLEAAPEAASPPLTGRAGVLYGMLPPEGCTTDRLQTLSNYPPETLQALLSSMELDGRIHRNHQQQWLKIL